MRIQAYTCPSCGAPLNVKEKESFTFGFLPHSYFCCDGQDYELGENRISAVCDSLHEMALENGETVITGSES